MGASIGWDRYFPIIASTPPVPPAFEMSPEHDRVLEQIYGETFNLWHYLDGEVAPDVQMKLPRPGLFGGWRKPLYVSAWRVVAAEGQPHLVMRAETGQLFVGLQGRDGCYMAFIPLRDYVVMFRWPPERLRDLLDAVCALY